jgi:hypothetical protein
MRMLAVGSRITGGVAMQLIASTCLAWVNLAGWLVVSVVLVVRREDIVKDEGLGCFLVIGLAVWLILCATTAVLFSVRSWRLHCCHNDLEYLGMVERDLTSSKEVLRLRALRTLADYCSEPLGAGVNLPFGLVENWQFKAMLSLLRRRAKTKTAQAAKPAPSSRESGPVLEPLRRGASETLERLGDAIKDTLLDWTPDDADHAEPSEEPLPPLHPPEFIEALRGPVDSVLSSLAASINAAPDARGVLAGRERCQQLFWTFLDGALELGLSMRVEAALATQPHEAAAASCGTTEWHPSERSHHRPSRSWVEKFRRMKADERELF